MNSDEKDRGEDKCRAVRCNLEDAGCGDEMIEKFLCCYRDRSFEEQLRILQKKRCELMGSMHECQKRLDCLDYLIFTLKKEHASK